MTTLKMFFDMAKLSRSVECNLTFENLIDIEAVEVDSVVVMKGGITV